MAIVSSAPNITPPIIRIKLMDLDASILYQTRVLLTRNGDAASRIVNTANNTVARDISKLLDSSTTAATDVQDSRILLNWDVL